MSHIGAIFMAALLCGGSLLPVSHAQTSTSDAAPLPRWNPVAEMAAVMPPAGVAWDDPAQPPSDPKPAAKLKGSRSRGMIAAGIGLIGGGLAFLIANPDLTEQYIPTSRGELYRSGYRAWAIGGAMAAGGGLMLWQGLRRRQ